MPCTRTLGHQKSACSIPSGFLFRQGDEKEEENIQWQLAEFVADETRSTLEFPATFSSHQRLQIHQVREVLFQWSVFAGCIHKFVNKFNALLFQVAERLGLVHVSVGEGKERRTVVSKLETETAENDTNDEVLPDRLSKDDSKEAPRNETAPMCASCHKQVPASNLALHHLRCKSAKAFVEKPDVKPKAVKKVKKEKAKVKDSVALPAEEDFDALIAAAVKENTTCAFKKCKTLTATLGHNCEFCAKRFCLGHQMPEIHGCGAQAKVQARRLISREGVLHSGSGVPSKKPDPDKRARLQRKLDSKLNEMTEQRKAKNKDSSK